MHNKHEKNQQYITYCMPVMQCSIWYACMQHALWCFCAMTLRMT